MRRLHVGPGYSIKGTIQYAGERAEAFEQPVVAVFADTTLSTGEDAPPPYALATFEDVDLDEPVPFELRLLLPGKYFLVALIGDLADFDAVGSPVGSYPDSCVLLQMPESRSVELDDEDLTGIDITVYDDLTDDPCMSESMGDGGVPRDAAAGGALEAHITAPGLSPASGDTLTLSLFDGFPGSVDPAYMEQIPGPSFPTTVTLEGIAPGDYTIVACFQAQDSESATCMGPDDRGWRFIQA